MKNRENRSLGDTGEMQGEEREKMQGLGRKGGKKNGRG
jgi:general stress protein YciG